MREFKPGDLVVTTYEPGVSEKVDNTQTPSVKIPVGLTGWVVDHDKKKNPGNVHVKLITGGEPVEFWTGYLRHMKEHTNA